MVSLRQFLFDLRETVDRALIATCDANRRELLSDAWTSFNEEWQPSMSDAASYLRLVSKIQREFGATLVAQSSALEHAILSGDAYNVRSAIRPLLETIDLVVQILDDVIGIREG